MMRSVLEELWYGNICPNSGGGEVSKETKELMGYVQRHRTTLLESFTEKQKEVFERLDDCYAELSDMNERKFFVQAFCLGAKMVFEIMNAELS